MSNHKNLTDLPARDGHELKRWCERNERVISLRECGDHVMVKGPHGTAVFPDREMGTGLWHKALKMLAAVGVALFAIACAVSQYAPLIGQ